MALTSYVFDSPLDTERTITIINNVISSLGGRTKRDGNVIVAWVEGQRFTFFVRVNDVKVVTSGCLFEVCNKILMELKNAC